jgi:hypothetical protein
MTEVLAAGRRLSTSAKPEHSADELWLSTAELHELTGWKLEEEGLCKGGACVPLAGFGSSSGGGSGPTPEPGADSIVQGDTVNASALWGRLGRPILHDAAHETWVLGEAAEDRARELESLEAPDFTLPDIEGKLHSLSDYRGQKVLLATWASW